MNFIGWALAAVLIVIGIRIVVQRRMLSRGQMQRCPYCDRPNKDDVIYCPHCGEVVKHGSFRR